MMSILSGDGDGATEEELKEPIEEDLQLNEQATRTTKKKSGRRTESTPAVIPATLPKPGSCNATPLTSTLDKPSSSERPKSPGSSTSERCSGIGSASAAVAEPDVTGFSEEMDSSKYSEERRESSAGGTEDTPMDIDDELFLDENLPIFLKKSHDDVAKRRTC
jgi:hypothetical protein